MSQAGGIFGRIGAPPQVGFLWSSNSPYLRDVWVRVRRTPRGPVFPPNIGRDANPAAIIYEVMTDTVWGIGAPSEMMDLSSFQAAATTLSSEKCGLSLTWSTQSTAEDFINIILEHIDGMFFVNPRTGLHTLRLARDDYDPDALREITPDIAQMVSFQWRGWGETSNEMQVTWTNPENEQEEVVTLQDLGNIAQQGAVVSASKNFFGARNANLAMQLCSRELRKAASPAVACEVMLLRHGWDLVPGDVVALSWPDYGVVKSIQRIAEVDYGSPTDAYIRVRMSEDVFSMARAEYSAPQGSEWKDPSTYPKRMTHVGILTLPAFLLSSAANVDLHSLSYPVVGSAILAASDAKDCVSYELMERVTTPAGSLEWESQGVKNCLSYGRLATPLAPEPETVITADSLRDMVGAAAITESILLLIGSGAMESREFAMVRSIDAGTGEATLDRGVMDTVPQEWPLDAPVWLVPPSSSWEYFDDTENAAGAAATYRLLSITPRGMLEFDEAVDSNSVLTDRPYRPLRPADVKVEGEPWDLVDLSDEPASSVSASVTWALRNRLTEDAIILPWEAPGVTPEDGQLTDIVVRSIGGSVLGREADIPGSSGSVDLTPFLETGTSRTVLVGAVATRDGFESIQGHYIPVRLPKPFDMMQDVFSDPAVEGVWFDPSDITTLFQDAAGTTPVLADGDPVGLMLDKHASGAWTKINSVDSVDGTPPGPTVTRYPVAEVVAGRRYLIQFDVVDFDGTGQAGMAAGPFGSATGNFTRGEGDGSYRSCLVCNTSGPLELFTHTTNTCNFRNIRVLEVTGNHASQETAAAKPTYRTDGTLHWLEFDTEDDNISWVAPTYSGGTQSLALAYVRERTSGSFYSSWRSRSGVNQHYFGLTYSAAGTSITGSSQNAVIRVNGDVCPNSRQELLYRSSGPLVGSLESVELKVSNGLPVQSVNYGIVAKVGGRLWGYVETDKPSFGVQRAQLEYWMAAKAGIQWW